MRNFLLHIGALGSALALSATSSSAQIFSPLHTFSTVSGFSAPLAQAADGTLYGTSSTGGINGYGSVFQIHPDGTGFAVLYSFTNGIDGSGPVAGLVVSGNTLYGTAKTGGSGGYGTVFKINTDGTGFVPLHVFTNGDGALPEAKLVLAGGVLYGTTYQGGSHSAGTVFKLNTDGSGFGTLFTFTGPGAGPGAYPVAGLVLAGSELYGTTEQGGSNFNGTVFAINTSGTGFTNLHSFSAPVSGTNSDGYHPAADLVLSNGVLYGTTMSGSPLGYGTVFRMNTDGSGFTNLYNFTSGTDGATPVAGLTLSGTTLYGTTTMGGGINGSGTIFQLNTDGSDFTVITSFGGLRGVGAPGAGTASLLLSGNTLFGAGGGVVFSLQTNGANPTILANGSDGAKPLGGLVLSGATGYGTTSAGGLPGSGTIFQVNTDGTGFSTLHVFSASAYNTSVSANTNADGVSPLGTLVLAGGKLYGVAGSGGVYGVGTIFSINTNGTGFTNLHSFTNVLDGRGPVGLVLGGSMLYGTTGSGGISNSGTLFRINTDGSDYATIFSFSNLDNPKGGLVLSGSTLYGTTFSGGANGEGAVFEINTNGTGFTVVYSFKSPTNSTDTVNLNGANPIGDLMLSGNTLYGTAAYGGRYDSRVDNGPGTLFKINTDGSGFTRLHVFGGTFDGLNPMGGLALSGSTLYGTTTTGGNGDGGTVFQLDTDGNNFTTIHTFPFQGGTPMGDLIVADGVIYGTSGFSVLGSGTVFSLTPTAGPTIHFTATPASGIPPQAVQFSAPGVDDEGNSILGWYWNFDDGTPTFTITYTTNKDGVISTNYNYLSTQNPLHTYTNNATFTPSLIATNNNGALVLGFGPAVVIAYPASILNGGFETGTFTNWTRSGNYTGGTISTTTQYKHSGSYGVRLSAFGTLGYLSQTLTTIPGELYLVSLWFDSPFNLTPNEFSVTWGGNVLLDQTNISNIGWTNIQLLVTATSPTTLLQLGFRDDSAYFGLDDVSVVSVRPVISGFAFVGTNLVLTNSGGLSNRAYVVLTSTNVAQPLSQWLPISTNLAGANGSFTITVTNAEDPTALQQFYLLHMQ